MSFIDVFQRIFPESVSTGAQLYLDNGLDVTHFSTGTDGVGSELTTTHVFNLYCATKPVIVLSALTLLEEAGVPCDQSTSICELLRLPPDTDAPVTLGQLLAHRAGLGSPELFDFLVAPNDSRAAMLPSLAMITRLRAKPEYSSVGLASILSRVVRLQLGSSLPEVVNECAERLGLDGLFVRRTHPPAIAVYSETTPDGEWPLLHDILPRFHNSPVGELTGGYGSAADLGRWLGAVLRLSRGDVVPGLPSPRLLASHFGPRDPGCEEGAARFAASFAYPLTTHGLSCASPTAFGHFGFVRTGLLYADPESQLVFVALIRALSMTDLSRRLAQWNDLIAELEKLANRTETVP